MKLGAKKGKGGIWESRYAEDRYFYGKEANEFVREQSRRIRKDGRVIEVASGEGRNAVFLAEAGFSVTAVEPAGTGVRKTLRLARERGVEERVEAVHGELRSVMGRSEGFDAAVITFLHLKTFGLDGILQDLKNLIVPGGLFIGEWFHPEQVSQGRTSGGPGDPNRMVDPEYLRSMFDGWDFEVLEVEERDLNEGRHQGPGVLTHVVARKPGSPAGP